MQTQARHETLIEKTSAFKILYQKQLLTKERAEEIVQQERAALAKETKTTASTITPLITSTVCSSLTITDYFTLSQAMRSWSSSE